MYRMYIHKKYVLELLSWWCEVFILQENSLDAIPITPEETIKLCKKRIEKKIDKVFDELKIVEVDKENDVYFLGERNSTAQ